MVVVVGGEQEVGRPKVQVGGTSLRAVALCFERHRGYYQRWYLYYSLHRHWPMDSHSLAPKIAPKGQVRNLHAN